jgi:succinate dehydrogenase flavin-adding protein (antitoxin of CptAB toxin-antitoxin module)
MSNDITKYKQLLEEKINDLEKEINNTKKKSQKYKNYETLNSINKKIKQIESNKEIDQCVENIIGQIKVNTI